MATLPQIIAVIAVGKANAMNVADFERAIGNQPHGTNNDVTRGEVTAAIRNSGLPIGSSPSCGYWLIDSDAECREVVDRINNTIASYEAKRDAIIDAWRRRKRSKRTGTPWPK